jgi:hypothetical protein
MFLGSRARTMNKADNFTAIYGSHKKMQLREAN